jgi:preprotein translocase subunit SecB
MTNQIKPADDAAKPAQPNIRVVGQYIKDLSFESPNIGKLMEGPVDAPQLQVEVNVNARQAGPDMFESIIDFTANATSKSTALYKLELEYGGMFKIEHMPTPAVEPFLLVNAPALLFPFLRRLIADLTREGGFPPLMLDPIDFGSLYMKRKQQGQPIANGNGKSTPTN